MIDTLNMGYKIANGIGPAEIKDFTRRAVGPVEVRSSMDAATGDTTVREWRADIDGLGACRLFNNSGTGYVALPFYALPRWADHFETARPMEQCHNDRVLTAAAADATWQGLCERVEAVFDMVESGGLSVSRADVVYQRRVQSSVEILTALYGAMRPTSKGTAWFANANGQTTGLVLKGLEVVHRCYDKGMESGRAGLMNVLRSEEQLRSKAAAFGRIVDVGCRTFNREECVTVLNERYLESTGEQLDVSPLVAAGQFAPALFALRPDLMDGYREQVDRKTYYRMRSKVRKIRAAAVPFDMSIPEDAWT